MQRKPVIPCLLAALFVTTAVEATPTLIAIGTLDGSADLSGLSDPTAKLENGLAGNTLGGMGSGLA